MKRTQLRQRIFVCNVGTQSQVRETFARWFFIPAFANRRVEVPKHASLVWHLLTPPCLSVVNRFGMASAASGARLESRKNVGRQNTRIVARASSRI